MASLHWFKHQEEDTGLNSVFTVALPAVGSGSVLRYIEASFLCSYPGLTISKSTIINMATAAALAWIHPGDPVPPVGDTSGEAGNFLRWEGAKLHGQHFLWAPDTASAALITLYSGMITWEGWIGPDPLGLIPYLCAVNFGGVQFRFYSISRVGIVYLP